MPAPRFHPFVRLLFFVIGALVISTAISGVVIDGLATAARLNGQDPQTLIAEQMSRNAIWLTVGSYPPILAWLWFCRRIFDRRSMAGLGLHTPHSGRLFLMGIAGGAGAIAFLCGALWLCGGVRINGIGAEAFDASPSYIVAMLGVYAIAFGVVGFMEELIFRGYGLHNMAAMIGPRGALWAQAIGFALIHLGNAAIGITKDSSPEAIAAASADALRAMPAIALAAWFFALTYFKTGSLWFAIGFHAAWNFTMGCVFSLPVSGINGLFHLLDVESSNNTWLSGGAFGPESSLLLIPILLSLIWLLRAQPDHPQIAHDLSLLDPKTVFAPAPVAPPANYETAFAAQETEEPRESRFKTSMRAADETPAWTFYPGQLPNSPSQSTAEPVVAAEIAVQSSAEPVATTEIGAQSTAEAPQISAESITAAEIAPQSTADAAQSTAEPRVADDAPAPIPTPPRVTDDTPRPPKKPAPRW